MKAPPKRGLHGLILEGLMTAKEELKNYIMSLSAEQIVKVLPQLILELEAQGLPVRRLNHLYN